MDDWCRTLSKLRLAQKRLNAPKTILGDILLEMINLCKSMGDVKSVKEYYWEYGSLYPDRIYDDDFEVVMGQPHPVGQSESLIDIGITGSTLMMASIKFSKRECSVSDEFEVFLLISNMSPAAFTLDKVVMVFSDETQLEIIRLQGEELLPGICSRASQILSKRQEKTLTIESLTLHLNCGVWVYFPLSSLATAETVTDVAFDDVSANWDFIRSLAREGFTEDALNIAIHQLRPQLKMDWKTSDRAPYVHGNPIVVNVTLTNPLPVVVNCSLRLSSHAGNLYLITENGALSELGEFHQVHLIDGQSSLDLALPLYSEIPQQNTILRLDADCYFPKADGDLDLYLQICPQSSELSLNIVDPFDVSFQVETLPTDEALDPSKPGAVLTAGLAKHYICVIVKSKSSFELVTSRLSIPGCDNEPLEPITDDLNPFKYLLSGTLLKCSADACLQPIFTINWTYHGSKGSNTYVGPSLNLSTKSIMVIAAPSKSDFRVGSIAEYSWLVWNMAMEGKALFLKTEPGEDYIWMGPKQERIHLPPRTCHRMSGWLVPLKVGILKPPILLAKSTSDPVDSLPLQPIIVYPPLQCTL